MPFLFMKKFNKMESKIIYIINRKFKGGVFMYCIKRDKYYSNDNSLCPFMAYYSQPKAPNVPCFMTNQNFVQGGCRHCQSFNINAIPVNYPDLQMNPMFYSNLYNYNMMGNMVTSMLPVPVEEIED